MAWGQAWDVSYEFTDRAVNPGAEASTDRSQFSSEMRLRSIFGQVVPGYCTIQLLCALPPSSSVLMFW